MSATLIPWPVFFKALQRQRSTLVHAWLRYWIFSDDGEALTPRRRDGTAESLSVEERLLGALVYWKILVCALLVILYSLRRYRPTLPLRGLTFIAKVYSVLGMYLVFHLIHSV